MLIIMDNEESKESKNKEINEPLYLLIMELTKKVIDLDRKLSRVLEAQDNIASKENQIQTSVENEKDLFDELNQQINQQFGNVDVLLGKYFQKFLIMMVA